MALSGWKEKKKPGNCAFQKCDQPVEVAIVVVAREKNLAGKSGKGLDSTSRTYCNTHALGIYKSLVGIVETGDGND